MFALIVCLTGIGLHKLKTRSDVPDVFDPDAVHDQSIVQELRKSGSMKSIASSQNLSELSSPASHADLTCISSSSSESDEEYDNNYDNNEVFCKPILTECEVKCRFCFQDETVGDLIAPCECKGSQEYVHLKCLRMWQKVSFRSSGTQEKSCRVCKQKYILPFISIKRRVSFYFSLKAKDRLKIYSQAWYDVVATAVMRARLQTRLQNAISKFSPLGIIVRRTNSVQELSVLLAMSELRLFAKRSELAVSEQRDDDFKIRKGIKFISLVYFVANVAAKVHIATH